MRLLAPLLLSVALLAGCDSVDTTSAAPASIELEATWPTDHAKASVTLTGDRADEAADFLSAQLTSAFEQFGYGPKVTSNGTVLCETVAAEASGAKLSGSVALFDALVTAASGAYGLDAMTSLPTFSGTAPTARTSDCEVKKVLSTGYGCLYYVTCTGEYISVDPLLCAQD